MEKLVYCVGRCGETFLGASCPIMGGKRGRGPRVSRAFSAFFAFVVVSSYSYSVAHAANSANSCLRFVSPLGAFVHLGLLLQQTVG